MIRLILEDLGLACAAVYVAVGVGLFDMGLWPYGLACMACAIHGYRRGN